MVHRANRMMGSLETTRPEDRSRPTLLAYLMTLAGTTQYSFLRSVWLGDMGCSGGEHGIPGRRLDAERILKGRAHLFSDDLVMSIATWNIINRITEGNLSGGAGITTLRQEFHTLVRPYFARNPRQFGTSFPRLLGAEGEADVIAARNRGPGAAMRVGSIALAETASDELAEAAISLTHLHPEGMGGAFAVYRAARELYRHRGDFAGALQEAGAGARYGQEVAVARIKSAGLAVPSYKRIDEVMTQVFEAGDAYHRMGSGDSLVSAAFVVPAVFVVLAKALTANEFVRSILEEAFAIGGDPDTIASIAMSLGYLLRPAQVTAETDGLLAQYQIPDIKTVAIAEL